MKALPRRVGLWISAMIVGLGIGCAWGQEIQATVILEERSNMWSRIWGSVLDDEGLGVALDPAGIAYVTGDTADAFAGQTNSGGIDLCLTQYAADGATGWTRLWGSPDADYGRKVARDRDGNVYVVGMTLGEFDGQTNAGGADFCLTKFTADGTRVWSRIWGSVSNDSGHDLAVDDLTNIYVVGFTAGAFEGQTNAGLYDLCLTKFNAAGEREWIRIWGSIEYDLALGVALATPSATCLAAKPSQPCTAASNIYVVGYTQGAFGGQTNAGQMDLCLTKWTAAGDMTWARLWGSASNDYGMGVAFDHAGNVFVAGDTAGEFGGQTNNGQSDLCLTKFNSGGTQTWVRIWGSASNEYNQGLALDSAGNPCVVGYTDGSFDNQVNNGLADICLTKLNSDGARAWTRIWGSVINDYGGGLALDDVGHIFAVGYTAGAFDGQTNAGGSDLCLTKWGFTAPSPVPYVSASDGTYTYKVLLSWGAATNAFGYRVWRNTANDVASAEEKGQTTATAWYDTAAVPGTVYYYWVQASNDVGLSAFSSGASGWRRSQASTDNAPSDLDGDRKKDPAVYQETTGDWLVMLSASHYQQQQAPGFGGTGYQAVAGDYDGDGQTDPAIYQSASGLWLVMLSGSQYASAALAGFGDVSLTPVPADYDGDGKTDPALYQEATGTWIVKMSKSGYAEASVTGFGGAGYQPLFGDFDGDGKNDPGVYAEAGGYFMILQSGSGYGAAQLAGFGGAGYRAVPGDFDADRKFDPAVYQEATGTWLVMMSADQYASTGLTGFGGPGYTAILGDFDQDYHADPSVYQRETGNWQIMMSGSHYAISTLAGFGGGGYTPLP